MWLVLTWLVVAVGIGLRVRQWWYARSFWLDELMLMNAMQKQRFTELLHPLANAQAAPPGWLLVEHVVVGLTGQTERGARFLALLLGCGALVLTVLLARTLLSGPAALVATALVAFSQSMIRYAAEFKQYSGDTFWLLALLLIGCRIALGRGRPDRQWWALAVLGGLVVWFSNAGMVAVFGIFAALGLLAAVRRDQAELRRLAVVAAPAVAGAAVLYSVLLSKTSKDQYLHNFWAVAFPPPGAVTPLVVAHWIEARIHGIAIDPLYWPVGPVLIVLAILGLAVLGTRTPAALLVLAGALGAIFVAGLVGAYPIYSRLALFAVPPAALLVAAATDLPALAGRVLRPRTVRPALGMLLAVAAAAGALQLTWTQLGHDVTLAGTPYQQEESRPIYARIARERQPGDLVLVDQKSARFSAEFYGPRLGLGSYRLIAPGTPGKDCPAGWVGDQLAPGVRRVWLVTVHTPRRDIVDFRNQLRQWGLQSESILEKGATAIRYDRYDPSRPATHLPRRCLRLASDPDSRPYA